MIMHPCPGCGRLIPVGVHRCPACKAQAEETRAEEVRRQQARYNEGRDNERKAFYKSKAWRMTSLDKLTRCPRCEAQLDGCQGLATEVHHIKPIRTPEGWEGRFDWDNLMAVCTRCHNKLDEKWGKATRRRPDGGDDPTVIDITKL